jgi:hypothetical protein
LHAHRQPRPAPLGPPPTTAAALPPPPPPPAAAVPVEQEDPLTLQQHMVWTYCSEEQRQSWRRGGPGLTDGGDGVSMWLPGGVVATIKTLAPAAPPAASGEDVEELGHAAGPGNGGVSAAAAVAAAAPKGLLFSFWWLVSEGTAMMVEREYDGRGYLVEVRHGTAVKGGWAGGAM